jgi:hypothetical protein
MNVAYADPPYPGQAHLYADHADYAGEVDHAALLAELRLYDGYCLHTSSPALPDVLALWGGEFGADGERIMAWVKPFAAFKSNISVAYAWEPVIVKACRKPVVGGHLVMRDYVVERITTRRGLAGAKPDAVCCWLFEVLGMRRDDTLVDLFPGTGAVGRAFDRWCRQPTLFDEVPA